MNIIRASFIVKGKKVEFKLDWKNINSYSHDKKLLSYSIQEYFET
jgi:hypothetical protein